jgi:hypothetical protein
LRHTATSLMKRQGILAAVVQDIIGHDSEAISAHYTHIDQAAKRGALEKAAWYLQRLAAKLRPRVGVIGGIALELRLIAGRQVESGHKVVYDSYLMMTVFSALAAQIHRELKHGEQCTVYEFDLIRVWSLNEKDRKAKIIQFATEHGFCMRFYRMGWCAIFERARWKVAARFTGSR